jgi:hypothetical protein
VLRLGKKMRKIVTTCIPKLKTDLKRNLNNVAVNQIKSSKKNETNHDFSKKKNLS